jgi:hypothetical protein
VSGDSRLKQVVTDPIGGGLVFGEGPHLGELALVDVEDVDFVTRAMSGWFGWSRSASAGRSAVASGLSGHPVASMW